MNQATGQAIVFARHPQTGGALFRNVRTCLTNIPTDAAVTLPPLARHGPIGLDLRRLLQRGGLLGAEASTTPARRPSPRRPSPAPETVQTSVSNDSSPPASPPPKPRRARGVRRRETEDAVILEPKE